MIKVDFAKGNGLVPVIVQEASSKDVLMLAYMNEESLRQTLDTGIATYYSRSRQGLWVKGETSGHYQYVKEIKIDCDEDTILLIVDQVGAACHTGAHSCFYRDLKG
ncbi:MAG: phosphoribosyl-AMP cyclohydrolase [Longicatena sp.]|nr:phosphoribosyl-AMP cyclohydrolase [Longicatena sp.]